LSRKLTLLTILTLALCATASADVVYTNFGPQGQYDTQNGWFVDGSDYNNQVIGVPFTPNFPVTLTDAILALGNYAGGNNPLDLYLYSDNFGIPGTQLATLTQQGTIQPFSSGGSLIQFNCGGCGRVEAGTRYWLVAYEPDPGTQQIWLNAYNDAGGDFVLNDVGSIDGPWKREPSFLPGYEVDGNDIPEPSGIVLMGSGLVVLVSRFVRR